MTIYTGVAGDDSITGSASADVFRMISGGQDTVSGLDGDDNFRFGSTLTAFDHIDGGDGFDRLILAGDHALTLDPETVVNVEVIRLGVGYDYSMTSDEATVAAGAKMLVHGLSLGSDDTLSFNGSGETDGSFALWGGDGNDVLTGGSGADTIAGGARGDTLTGNAGADVFRYRSLEDSNSTERDGIQDFNAGDLIDLRVIDANSTTGGNQAFTFIGSAAFSNTAGELRFENISLGGPIWLVLGDVDGNGVSDWEVVLVISPADPITAEDFVL